MLRERGLRWNNGLKFKQVWIIVVTSYYPLALELSKNRHSCMLPSQAWAQALAGIYIFSNGSPIKDFGDDDLFICTAP